MAQAGGDPVNFPGDDETNGVHEVDENEFTNMRLCIGTVGKTMVQISLTDSLNDTKSIEVRLRNGAQAAGGAAGVANHALAPGDPAPPANVPPAVGQVIPAAHLPPPAADLEAEGAPREAAPPQGRLKITVAADHDGDREYLDKMRGWLMAVAALFVNMAFQAVLHPPDWFKTEWYFKKKHGKAGSPLAAPALSPHPADTTGGEHLRAVFYLLSNLFTFGTALALMQVLLWETPYSRRTMTWVRVMMALLSFYLAWTLALGTADNWAIIGIVCGYVVLYAVVAVLGSLCMGKSDRAVKS